MRATRRASTGSPGGFRPICCPNPHCRFHLPHPTWRFTRAGFDLRPEGRRLQRYRCARCRTRFSAVTFRTTYWLRRPELLLPIARLISQGTALRQIARVLGTSHATVARHVARLGRHCLLFHRRQLQGLALTEPLVIDGFETFEYSQYFPFHANLAVGAHSWFLYHFTDSPLRRKGTMTPFQKRRRSELEQTLGRPDPKAVERGIVALLCPVLRQIPAGRPLRLHSDDHPAYQIAVKHLQTKRRRQSAHLGVRHEITSATERRTTANPLFPVNLADLLLRHSNANHHRETIAFSKRRQAALERLAVFTVWRNYVKRRREKGPPESAAMWLRLTDRLLSWREILRRRCFPAHVDLPREWEAYYWRKVRTLALGAQQTTHACRYAF